MADDCMLAAVFNGGDSFEVKEVPKPECPRDGVLLKVHACGMCGSDVKALDSQLEKLEHGKVRELPLPIVLGHEFSGTVAEVGDDVDGYAVGDAVAVGVTVPCLDCESCRRGYHEMCDRLYTISYDSDGGFAEYVAITQRVIRAGCLVKLQDPKNLESAALTEPLSDVVNALERSPVKEGDFCVVIGSGPFGTMMAELARVRGAGTTVMVGRRSGPRRNAEVAGCDYYFDSSVDDVRAEVDRLTDRRGADLVVAACPSGEAQILAFDIVAKRGYVNLFSGLPRDMSVLEVNTNLIHYKECAVVGTHGSSPAHIREALSIIETGRMDAGKYITHRFALADINEALEAARARTGSRLRILVKP